MFLMAPRPKNGNEVIRPGFVGLYLPVPMKAKIQRLAKSENRSLSNMCEVLINEALEARQSKSENGQKAKMWGEESTITGQQPTDS